jgi:hypothetical protein
LYNFHRAYSPLSNAAGFLSLYQQKPFTMRTSMCCRLLSKENEKRVAEERTLGRRWSFDRSDGSRGAGVPAPLFIREIGVEIPEKQK